ncbi:MAG: CPBP family intramembrane glutamic endopeptidase [Verrucomicrobiota bacterium]
MRPEWSNDEGVTEPPALPPTSSDSTSTSFSTNPWRFVLYALVAYGIYWIVQIASVTVVLIAAAVMKAVETGEPPEIDVIEQLAVDGDVFSVTFLISTLLLVPLLYLANRFLHQMKLGDGFALHPFRWKVLGVYLLITTAFFFLCGLIDLLLDRSFNETMEAMLLSADSRSGFYFVIIVCAPLLEETLFRGYLQRQLLRTPLGKTPVIVLVAILFSVSHLQYGVIDLFYVFGLGLILGYVRQHSGSLWPCILIHLLWNAVASLFMEHYLHGL